MLDIKKLFSSQSDNAQTDNEPTEHTTERL